MDGASGDTEQKADFDNFHLIVIDLTSNPFCLFRRLTEGLNRSSYFEEHFLRDMPWLCKKMSRHKVGGKADLPARKLMSHFCPFYFLLFTKGSNKIRVVINCRSRA